MNPPRDVFQERESEVRVYSRKFPRLFTTASGAWMRDEAGREYLDFLCGAGALNYGHNHPHIRQRVIDYLAHDGIIHGLDLHTAAKRGFLEAFTDVVLAPRALDYKVQFTGPTGTNAVEAAFKLARRITGRTTIAAFTGGFHGLSLGALAATANGTKRAAAGVPLQSVHRFPYDGYLGPNVDTIDYIERLLDDPGSGIELPAAIIVESVQGEGGIQTASPRWMQRLARAARERSILLIADEIQTGCGRTGTFFSFEESGIVPDLVCVSKSIGGLGLPMALLLVRRELDVQRPGEHSGTFRGHNLAFVAAEAALDLWRDPSFLEGLARNVADLDGAVIELASRYGARPAGRGLLRGLVFDDAELPSRISAAALERGLLVETSGVRGQTLKLMPPLTIGRDELRRGLELLDAAIADCVPVAAVAFGE